MPVNSHGYQPILSFFPSTTLRNLCSLDCLSKAVHLKKRIQKDLFSFYNRAITVAD